MTGLKFVMAEIKAQQSLAANYAGFPTHEKIQAQLRQVEMNYSYDSMLMLLMVKVDTG